MKHADVLSAFSLAEARRIDQTCDQFESEWRAGRRPDLAAIVLSATEPTRSALLRLLLPVEWEYRRHAGESPQPGDYQTRFPQLAPLVDGICSELQSTADSTWEAWQTNEDNSENIGVNGVATPSQPSVTSLTGSDRYQLLHEVGHGGIGVVFRVHDRMLGRESAVKMLHDEHLKNADARRRLMEEARVGSQLQHPAIVPVYEIGTFDDRPYFAMKLVEGKTFAELLRSRTDPNQDLSRMLGIFEHVCQAMAYAHSKGVVHRDLKPSNIMVGAFGEVQVMDWGFAKQLQIAACKLQIEDASRQASDSGTSNSNPNFTHSGALMGTPAYMPPEQARGEIALIDQRTDVFALGAILCEILTGKPPYAEGLADERCRQAAEGNLADANARLESCGADEALRALAQQCLAPDRKDRPADAGIVAENLTAYLAASQERLRRAQLERMAAEARAKSERRARRLTMALAGAIAVGGAIAIWLAVVANHAKRDAWQAAEAEATAKTLAQDKEAETKAVFTFFRDRVLEAARPKGTAGGLGKDATIRDALDRAEPEIAKTFIDQPVREALVRYTLGQNYHYLGDQKKTLRQIELALALQRQHLPPDHPDTLASMNMLAVALKELNHLEEAAKILDETLQSKRRVRGTETRSTLLTMVNLAGVLVQLRRFDEARRLYDEALPIERRVLGPEDNLTLDTMSGIAIMLISEGKVEESRKLAEETYLLKERKLGPEHISTMGTLSILAGITDELGRLDEAVKLYEEALRRQNRILSADHRDTLRTKYNFGTALIKLERFEEAAKLFRETWEAQSRVLGPEDPRTVLSMSGLAAALDGLGQADEANQMFADALEIQRRRLGPEHPYTLEGMYNLANSHFKLGRWEESRKLHEDSIPLRQRILGQTDGETLKSMDSLAWLLVTAADNKVRDSARAIELSNNVVKHATKTGHQWTTLGVAHYRAGHWDEAVAAFQKAETLGPGARNCHNAFFLAMTYWQKGVKDEARNWYDKGIERMAKHKPGDTDIMRSRTEAAELLGVHDR